MKKDLQTETPTVNINILRVVCFPVMVKKRRITTITPTKYEMSLCEHIYNYHFFLNLRNLLLKICEEESKLLRAVSPEDRIGSF